MPDDTNDTATLLDYVERGLIKRSVYGDFSVWNYTPDCQFSKAWDSVTEAHRGVATYDPTGEVLTRPFHKFFNVDERREGWPDGPFTATEKMDGSLGIGFRFNGEDHWTTRGSMGSPQAAVARRLWADGGQQIPDGFTVLVEIISPVSRVVVDYGDDERLVLLAAFRTSDGWEMPRGDLELLADRLHLAVVPVRNFASVREMLAEAAKIDANTEGWVLRWEVADGWADGPFRLKVKGHEYMKAHRLLAGMNERRIAEAWRDGDLAAYATLSDDHKAWIAEVTDRLDLMAIDMQAEVEELVAGVRSLLPDFGSCVRELGGPKSPRFSLVMNTLRGMDVDFRAEAAKALGAHGQTAPKPE